MYLYRNVIWPVLLKMILCTSSRNRTSNYNNPVYMWLTVCIFRNKTATFDSRKKMPVSCPQPGPEPEALATEARTPR